LAYLILVGILQSRRLKLSDQLLNKPDQFLLVFFVLDQASQLAPIRVSCELCNEEKRFTK
jgi:hypothetical protein